MGLPICPPGPPGERLVECLPASFLPHHPALYCRMETGAVGARYSLSFVKVTVLPSTVLASTVLTSTLPCNTLQSGFQHFVTIMLVKMSSYENAMQDGLALRATVHPKAHKPQEYEWGVWQAQEATF